MSQLLHRTHWITRQKHGKGFAYYDNGYLVTDTAAIAYYRSLAVPPAWREVRIATDRDAKILATGLDGAGQRQSVYHPKYCAKQGIHRPAYIARVRGRRAVTRPPNRREDPPAKVDEA